MFTLLNLNKIIYYLVALFLFLLPWQTRYIYQPAWLNSSYWEYGTLSLYATELLGWGIIVLCGLLLFLEVRNNKEVGLKNKIIPGVRYALPTLVILSFFIFHSLNFDLSLQWVVRAVQALCLGLILVRCVVLSSGPSNIVLPFSFWLGGIGQALFGMWQFYTQSIPANKWLGLAAHRPNELGAVVIEYGGERILRAYGAFGSPNSLGIYLAPVLVTGLILSVAVRNKKIKRGVVLGQLIILSGLLVSFSRGAWVAAFLGSVTFFFLASKNYVAKHCPGATIRIGLKQIGLHLLPYIISISIFFIFAHPLIGARLNVTNRLENRSLSERRTQWSEALPLLKDNWLWGVGPGNYTLGLAIQYPGRPAWAYQPLHNIFGIALIEWGVVGVVGLVVAAVLIDKKRLFFTWLHWPLVVMLATAGLFDHWLVSLYTGLLLLVVPLSLAVGLAKSSTVKSDIFVDNCC